MKTEKELRRETEEIRLDVAEITRLYAQYSRRGKVDNGNPGLTIILTLLVLLGLLVWFACGCTVTPRQVHSTQYSWDQDSGKQDSGWIGFNEDGSGTITPHARDRYNALIVIYGKRFLVPLKADDGLLMLPDGNWRIDKPYVAQFMKMQRWRREGL